MNERFLILFYKKGNCPGRGSVIQLIENARTHVIDQRVQAAKNAPKLEFDTAIKTYFAMGNEPFQSINVYTPTWAVTKKEALAGTVESKRFFLKKEAKTSIHDNQP